ncbi:uncharacterized protein QC764_703520 [Podospora pseudoanserina]|uniref:Uncharacterized protein n=1 Tax=Podospora pseudoanserina TaxID=2609844 RepID=A0ABR0HIM8_9PEZI|nr:hypothetical protein QC764_703520 [Podospora pseudoanserina]
MSSTQEMASKNDRPDHEFWNAFIHGTLLPWRHRDYVRAAYMTILLHENRDRGLLEIASDFAANMLLLKQRASRLNHQPESRTETVFWLYQIKSAIEAAQGSSTDDKHFTPPSFDMVLAKRPELLGRKLIDQYYSVYLQNMCYTHRYYVLPNLKPLEPPRKAPRSFFGFGNNSAPEPFEHERYLNMAFAIVQRYLREGETRRRSWFIERGFDALRQQFMRMRAPVDARTGVFAEKSSSGLEPFSETKAYFYVQLVHIALTKLTTGGHHDMVQRMRYQTFKRLFGIEPNIWKKHYSAKRWTSFKALGGFQPPDLKPLPDTIDASYNKGSSIFLTALGGSGGPSDTEESIKPKSWDDLFLKEGLEPELPLEEVIAFHRSILLEDAKSIDPTAPLSPSHLPTPAHLLKYIYTTLLTASSMATLPTRATHCLSTLLQHAPLPKTHLIFYLNYLLNFCTPGIELAYPGLFPSNKTPSWQGKIQFRPITTTTTTNPETNKTETRHTRYHNCPCHNGTPLPYYIGPSACEYPVNFPYEHPPQLYHGCSCHKEEKIDQDKLAEIVAGMYAEREASEVWKGGQRDGNTGFGKKKVRDREEMFVEWVRRWPELVFVEFSPGGEKRGLVEIWEGREREMIMLMREEDGGVGVMGVVPVADGEGEEEGEGDEKTLAGDREVRSGDEEDWELLSQAGTLCEK